MPSTEIADDAIRDLGFYSEQDATVGTKTSTIKRMNCLSKEGLDFYEANVLNDIWRAGGGDAGRRVLVVQLWDIGSTGVYYAGSHRHALATANAANGLFETPLAALKNAGCSEGTTVNFEHGGLTIQDARTAFRIIQGMLNATVFTTEDVAKMWPEMVFPNTQDVRQKVREIRDAPADGVNIPSQFRRRPGLHARFESVAM
ncbi:hypothetical protein F5883DRAFT_653375 [Diaporthe sp. PMI_573]|nr:hypothetical protein F5883DRAFT_653375 [Diaporthaceae sp. PMI_573]